MISFFLASTSPSMLLVFIIRGLLLIRLLLLPIWISIHFWFLTVMSGSTITISVIIATTSVIIIISTASVSSVTASPILVSLLLFFQSLFLSFSLYHTLGFQTLFMFRPRCLPIFFLLSHEIFDQQSNPLRYLFVLSHNKIFKAVEYLLERFLLFFS